MTIVRKMEQYDVQKVARLEEEIFKDPWSSMSIEETRIQKHTICIVAESEGRLEGYMLGYCAADQCEIARIAVNTEVRRKGIASALMLYLENECEENEICRILLDVQESNRTAYEFYLSCNFTEDGIRRKFYRNPEEDAILMSRSLNVR